MDVNYNRDTNGRFASPYGRAPKKDPITVEKPKPKSWAERLAETGYVFYRESEGRRLFNYERPKGGKQRIHVSSQSAYGAPYGLTRILDDEDYYTFEYIFACFKAEDMRYKEAAERAAKAAEEAKKFLATRTRADKLTFLSNFANTGPVPQSNAAGLLLCVCCGTATVNSGINRMLWETLAPGAETTHPTLHKTKRLRVTDKTRELLISWADE